MRQYPTVDDIIESNKVALRKGRDRHPHKLSVTKKALESIIRETRNMEKKGVEYQAAFIMQKVASFQAFASANHRTGFYVGELFLRLNGLRVHVTEEKLYQFINDVDSKTLEEVEKWIRHVTTTKKP